MRALMFFKSYCVSIFVSSFIAHLLLMHLFVSLQADVPSLPKSELIRLQAERTSRFRAAIAAEKQTLMASTVPADRLALRLMNSLDIIGAAGSVGKMDAKAFLDNGVHIFFFLRHAIPYSEQVSNVSIDPWLRRPDAAASCAFAR